MVERILTDSPYHSVQIRNQNCFYNAATTSDHVFEILNILTVHCSSCLVIIHYRRYGSATGEMDTTDFWPHYFHARL